MPDVPFLMIVDDGPFAGLEFSLPWILSPGQTIQLSKGPQKVMYVRAEVNHPGKWLKVKMVV